MNNSPTKPPKNTTKRTGIGCAIIGFLFLSTAICIIFVGVIFGLESTYIAIGATLSALGIIAILPGIGLFFKGRQVDKMLSGEDLLANWNYLVNEKGDRESGYVYIGTKGIYKKGFYLNWSRNCVLQDVQYQEGTPTTIIFQYLIGSYSNATYGRARALKKFRIPVPPDKKEDAMRVIQYYKQKLQEKSTKHAAEFDKT